ncbi:FGGY-family carbohydrate kinase [Streptomyces iconiensis]|uniref:FGGY family carbohydrate kinase n=1 Tax=Streptomyces iconiensis TaxID=1384038 RepID=A0ABT7A7T0_9ACTN|nr:FGGY family carbohydrate kinase [Streptomyces iconiensis]MDJ1137079.1 FGGY family carbohydrate kinase [Streptomyces iconiensis]
MDSAAPASASATPVVAGIDVATAAVRVLCADARGTVLAEGRAPLPQPVRDPRGHSEQDAATWWPAAAEALRQATSALPARGAEVVAVAVCATSGTLVLADGDGVPLGPALMYDDRRAAGLNARAQEAGAARWAALGLTVGPTAALGRVGWYAAHAGDFPGAARILHTPDLLGHRLTGGPVPADWSHALKTGYDPLAGEWPTEVLDALGVPARWLPTVRAPGTGAGTVSARAAAETGLPEGCEVRLGMTDGCAGQIATGAVRPGQFVGVLGTTYVLKGVTRELVTDPAGALYSHRHPDGWWLPGGASNTGGEALARTESERLAELDTAAHARGPASCVSYPLRREGERFPFVAAGARGFTLGTPADEAHRHRADLEGVAFLERLALERVRSLGVPVAGPLYAAGGGSRSVLWNRIRATVLGLPLRVAERAETAFGAALLAAAGTLHPTLDEAATAMTGEGHLVEPVPGEKAALDASYARFVAELERRGWLSAPSA